MSQLKPLINSVGQPVEGSNKYFLRPKIIKKIIRRLNNGENLIIAAPRRIGKSSILKNLKKNPPNNQIIKYIPVESVNSSEEFFKNLYETLITDQRIHGHIKKIKISITNNLKKIKSVSLLEIVSIKTYSQETKTYYDKCLLLLSNIKDKKIWLFIDEFPDALNNIRKQNKNNAIHFLQQHYDLRNKTSDTEIRFVYTGSTGLLNIIRKLNVPRLINNTNTVKIPILNQKEAKEFIQCLELGCKEPGWNSNFNLTDQVIDHIVERITWRLPYYLQMIIEQLFEYYEDTEQEITIQIIEDIFQEIVNHKFEHANYFLHWQTRLCEINTRAECKYAIKILNHIAKHNSITYAQIVKYAKKKQLTKDSYKFVINFLEYDGYISENQKVYGFNSFLLKEWWKCNVL